jgi:hypothetical protein
MCWNGVNHREETVRRLRQLAALKAGDLPPDWMPDNAWAEPLSKLCADAADLIEGDNGKRRSKEG